MRNGVQPAFELEADAAQDAGVPESKALMEADGGGIVAAADDGDHLTDPPRPQASIKAA